MIKASESVTAFLIKSSKPVTTTRLQPSCVVQTSKEVEQSTLKPLQRYVSRVRKRFIQMKKHPTRMGGKVKG